MQSPLYPYIKLLHVLSVVLFVGNIAAGQFWLAHAYRTREPRHIVHAIDGVLRSTNWITMPSATLIIVCGWIAAWLGHISILHTLWIQMAIGLFVLSGAIFVVVLEPQLRRMRAVAGMSQGAASSMLIDWASFDHLHKRFKVWSAIGLLAPVAAVAVMVVKPGS